MTLAKANKDMEKMTMATKISSKVKPSDLSNNLKLSLLISIFFVIGCKTDTNWFSDLKRRLERGKVKITSLMVSTC